MLHILFEKVAAEYPANIAVAFENQRPLTYGQLDHLANQLAHLFLAKGVRVQDYVAVRLERGVLQIAVFLALLKIGAVYVPISCEQPSFQLKQILQNCNPRYLVMDSLLVARSLSRM